MNKLKKYISNESKLEQASRSKMTIPPNTYYDDENVIKRQKIRIFLFYIIIFLFFIFLIKSIVNDLTLFGMSGVNLFNNCTFPK